MCQVWGCCVWQMHSQGAESLHKLCLSVCEVLIDLFMFPIVHIQIFSHVNISLVLLWSCSPVWLLEEAAPCGLRRIFILIVWCIAANRLSGYMQGVCRQHTCGYMSRRPSDMMCVYNVGGCLGSVCHVHAVFA